MGNHWSVETFFLATLSHIPVIWEQFNIFQRCTRKNPPTKSLPQSLMGIENRLHTRVSGKWPVFVVTADGLMHGVAENISPSGICIRLSKGLRRNENMLLTIRENSSHKRVLGRIVWLRVSHKDCERYPAKIGVRFVGDLRTVWTESGQGKPSSRFKSIPHQKALNGERTWREEIPKGHFPLSGFQERRRFPRTAIEWPVIIKTKQGFVAGETSNVSGGGASILCIGPPNKGEVLATAVRIPEAKRFLLVRARVAWSDADTLPFRLAFPRIGVSFTNLTEDHRLFLLSILPKNPERAKTSAPQGSRLEGAREDDYIRSRSS